MKLNHDDSVLSYLKRMDLNHSDKISSSQIDKGMAIVAESDVDVSIKRGIRLIL